MRNPLISRSAWIAAACMAAVLVGCGKKEEPTSPPYVMPEVNEANCKLDAIKKMPADVQQRFGSMCARRTTAPIRSEQKSYGL